MAASTTLGPGRPSLFSQMAPSLQASLLAPTIPSTLTPVPSLSTPQRPSSGRSASANTRREKSSSISSAVSDHAPTSPQPPASTSPSPSSPLTSAPSTTQTATVTPAPPSSHFNILNPSVDVASLGRIKDLESQLQALKTENEHQVRAPFSLSLLFHFYFY